MHKTNSLREGDVLLVEYRNIGLIGYDHYGIYSGNDTVIHFHNGKIAQTSFRDFIAPATLNAYTERKDALKSFCMIARQKIKHLLPANASIVYVVDFKSGNHTNFSKKVTLYRALTLVDSDLAALRENQCEHFTAWCRTGMTSRNTKGKKEDLTTGAKKNIVRTVEKINAQLGFQYSRKLIIEN